MKHTKSADDAANAAKECLTHVRSLDKSTRSIEKKISALTRRWFIQRIFGM